MLAPELNATDEEAQAAFRARYGSAEPKPIVVVIAAYEEEASIGGVLDELPTEWRGLGVMSIVVVDGGHDAPRRSPATTGRSRAVRWRSIEVKAHRCASAMHSHARWARVSS